MKQRIIRFSVCALLIVFGVISATAQTSSGGKFTIRKSVISAGGDAGSNGIFKITGTIGQPLIEKNNSSPFTIKNGFWTPQPFAPTAAAAGISGRVTFGKDRGVANATVYLTGQDGNIRTARTNQFGYFRFEDIEVGQTLLVNAFHKQFQFDPQIINFDDSISGLNITAQ